MNKKHMKSMSAPRAWPILRKKNKYTTRPNPGKSFKYSMPINIILKDFLKIANTTREAKYILRNKEILVDGKKRIDFKLPVGFMDVITVPELDEVYRVLITQKGKISFHKIQKEESDIKILKITGKTKIKKGKLQLNLFDSSNMLVDKDVYAIGDSVVVSLKDKKIKSVLKLEKGAFVIMLSGKYIGKHGVIESVSDYSIIVNIGDVKAQTLKEYAYVLGKEKPEIKMLD
jgi:small subunit ribosomal protein S4e